MTPIHVRAAEPSERETSSTVTHVVTHSKALTGVERQARYRGRNPERYRQRHCDLMRRNRASKVAQHQSQPGPT